MHHQLNQKVKINGDILQYIVNKPKKTRPPLILYEDGLAGARGTILTPKGKFQVRKGCLYSLNNNNQINSSIGESFENLALVHALQSLVLEDGIYIVEQLNWFTNDSSKYNYPLEKIAQIKSIFIDTDGLDVTVLSNSEIEFTEEGSKLPVTTQPIFQLLNKIRMHTTLFRERDKPISISFINPNLEGLEFSGVSQKLSDEQIAKFSSENIGFSSLRIDSPEGRDIDLVCNSEIKKTNPKNFLKRQFNYSKENQKPYNDFLKGLIKRFEHNMAVNLDDILSRYLPNRNPSTQLHAYVKKLNRPPLWVYNK